MSITYDDALTILDEFKKLFQLSVGKRGINSLVVMEDESGIYLEVGVAQVGVGPTSNLPAAFDAGVSALPNPVQIRVTERGLGSLTTTPNQSVDERAAMYCIGDPAKGVGNPHGTGTAGWFYYAQDINGTNIRLVCMSNWHVLCSQGNRSLRGHQRCELRGDEIATLYDYIDITGNNRFDVAWAVIDDDKIGSIEPTFRHCSHPYPSEWTAPSKVRIGASVHKDGYISGCTRGTLIGFGDLEVRGIGYFNGQLIFNAGFWTDGDSGSITVLDEDNTVMGLNFATQDRTDFCFSNPIYQSNLTLIGWRKTRAGAALPILSQPLLAADNAPSEDGFPQPGHRYVCGFQQSNQQPHFDGRVDYLGADLTPDRNDGDRTISQWLLLGKSDAPEARLIRNVTSTTSLRYQSRDGEITFWTHFAFGGIGTVLELCDRNDPSGYFCFGVGWTTNGRWTFGPPVAPGVDMRVILIADYHEPKPGGGRYETNHIQRFLFWGR